jgi:hypothetical protein
VRSNVPTRISLTPEKAEKAYRVFGSLRKAGEVLGVSYQSVRRRLKEGGVPIRPVGGAGLKGRKYIAGHRGGLARFLRDYPGVKLPLDYEGIQKLIKETSGEEVSLDAIKAYIYRRRKAEKERMLSLPPLSTLPGTFRLEDGRSVPYRSIQSVKLSLDYRTFEYLAEGKLRTGGSFSARLRFDLLKPSLESRERL